MTETFEDKCKRAYQEHLEYVEGETEFASVGYADDPRALLGMAYSSDNSNHGTSAREIWTELDNPAIADADIGHARLERDGSNCGLYATPPWGRLCDPFTVYGSGVDPNTKTEIVVLRTLDATGRVRTLRLPRGIIAGNDSAFASYCADRGFDVSHKKGHRRILQAMLSFLKGPRIGLTTQAGWFPNKRLFVLPTGTVIGSDVTKIIFTADSAEAANTVGQSGTYQGWRDMISETVTGNSRFELALCAGLYSPMMRFSSNAACAVFNIYGETSLGKSTAGRIFGSVWGGSKTRPLGYAHSWNQTKNSLMALAGAYSGIGLSLDEIQHCPDPDIAYTFSDGEERGRLHSDARQKTRRTWQCIAWSTGEKKLEDLVNENVRTKAFGVQSGREARFFDIPVVGTGSLKGAVEGLNGFDSPEALIDGVNRGTRQNYGFAGPEFVARLINYADEHGEPALTTKINATSDRVLAALDLSPDAHSVVKRVARAFAEVGAAGVLAAEFDIIPNKTDELIDGVVRCFQDWLAERGSVQFTQADIRPIIATRDFISSNKLKFLDLTQPPEQKFGEVVGYTKVIDGEPCYLFNNASWAMVQKIGKRSNLAENLNERGLLVTKSGNSLKVQVRFKDLSGAEQRERFYAVSSRILLVDDFGQYVPPDSIEEDDELASGRNLAFAKAKRSGQRSMALITGGRP